VTRILEFPDFPGVSANLSRELVMRSRQLHVPQGTEVFAPGGHEGTLLILLSGTLRVGHTTDTGHEIVLYRASAGEGCSLTMACLLAEASVIATGIAETDLDLISVSKAAFDDLMSCAPDFRGLIFRTYSRRMTDLMRGVERIARGRIESQLAGRLIDLAGGGTQIVATPQQIATDLGITRDVVSDQLDAFEQRGWIEVHRWIVRLSDKDALAEVARSDRAKMI